MQNCLVNNQKIRTLWIILRIYAYNYCLLQNAWCKIREAFCFMHFAFCIMAIAFWLMEKCKEPITKNIWIIEYISMQSLQDVKCIMHHAFFIMLIVFCLMKIKNTQSKETSISQYSYIPVFQYLNTTGFPSIHTGPLCQKYGPNTDLLQTCKHKNTDLSNRIFYGLD